MLWRVAHHVGLAVAVPVRAVELEEVLHWCCGDVAHYQKTVLDIALDWFPDVEDSQATGQELLDLVLKQLAYMRNGPDSAV